MGEHTECDDYPYMSFSRDGKREHREGIAYYALPMAEVRRCATGMLLGFWDEGHLDAAIWIDDDLFTPSDEEIVAFEERLEAFRKGKPVPKPAPAPEPDDLVSAHVEADEPERAVIQKLVVPRRRKHVGKVLTKKGKRPCLPVR